MVAPAGQQKSNIREVAVHAGVSHMTISRVLNEKGNVAPETRRRVLAAMRELNYRPNGAARALASRKTNRVGVIVEGVVEFGPGSTVRAIEDAAHRRGYTVSTIAVDNAVTPRDAIDTLDAVGIDALCLISPRVDSLNLLRERALTIPTLIVKPPPESDFFTISVDQALGSRLAVEHLLNLGHRKILHLAGPRDWLDARARELEWQRCLERARLPAITPAVGDWTSNSGYAFGKSIKNQPKFTAVFAANDQMALGLIHALHESGLRVPDDVSVVGFDDLPDARHYLPPLTTVRQDFRELGTRAIEIVLADLEGLAAPDGSLIAPSLVVRASTSAPRV
jgi:DNA-binding LacI/PurR family transcriptional regulator